ncbi:Raf kinase inhibitor-like YbhB/YbcL family protein [Streptacidiphilus sp. MAP12-16]|uniref:YbhB/YbcL family Raf kinase inhibitor-like protein n=1 Tax=Streptacidiphilus sp. MAP12-16 TaxID=3156300 RepID=UPI003515D2B9
MIRNTFRYAVTATALAAAVCTLAGFTAGRPAQSSEPSAAVASASVFAADANAPLAEWQRRDHPNPYAYLPKVPSFRLSSATVRNGRPLPTPQLSGIFGVPGGKDVSPQLSWSGFPARSRSFVVSMYDPEAPTGSGFWHWVVADIPASTTSLPENAGTLNSTSLPAGAFQLDGDAGMPRYIGGAPPAHSGVHDYYITVTALDIPKTGLNATTSGALLGFSIDSHTVARATLVLPTAAH